MVWSVSSDKWKVPFIERPSRVLKTKFTFWPTQWSHSPWFISFKYFKNGPAIASASLLPASLSMRQIILFNNYCSLIQRTNFFNSCFRCFKFRRLSSHKIPVASFDFEDRLRSWKIKLLWSQVISIPLSVQTIHSSQGSWQSETKPKINRIQLNPIGWIVVRLLW